MFCGWVKMPAFITFSPFSCRILKNLHHPLPWENPKPTECTLPRQGHTEIAIGILVHRIHWVKEKRVTRVGHMWRSRLFAGIESGDTWIYTTDKGVRDIQLSNETAWNEVALKLRYNVQQGFSVYHAACYFLLSITLLTRSLKSQAQETVNHETTTQSSA